MARVVMTHVGRVVPSGHPDFFVITPVNEHRIRPAAWAIARLIDRWYPVAYVTSASMMAIPSVAAAVMILVAVVDLNAEAMFIAPVMMGTAFSRDGGRC